MLFSNLLIDISKFDFSNGFTVYRTNLPKDNFLLINYKCPSDI